MKILYLMQVDWNWIKQRPQIIAELLSIDFDVHVFSPYQYNRKNLCNNGRGNVVLHEYYPIPFQSRIRYLKKLNKKLVNNKIQRIISREKPDYVWIGSPYYSQFLNANEGYKVVYDCMDDYYSMSGNAEVKSLEEHACENSSAIFVSSNSLSKKLVSRYGVDENKITLVRNGYQDEAIFIESHKPTREFHIGYVGTISDWFDFNSLLFVLDNTNNVIFDLYGPCKQSIRDKITDSRIVFHGTIEHSEIYSHVKTMDCLIMPFVLNDIIESVDPVKLYEYINFEKNIISVKYEEILRFGDFVEFYSDENELLNIVKTLYRNNRLKYTLQEKEMFLKNNTWEARIEVIKEYLQ